MGAEAEALWKRIGDMRLCVQVGRFSVRPAWSHPAFWVQRTLTQPRRYGLGVFLER